MISILNTVISKDKDYCFGFILNSTEQYWRVWPEHSLSTDLAKNSTLFPHQTLHKQSRLGRKTIATTIPSNTVKAETKPPTMTKMGR